MSKSRLSKDDWIAAGFRALAQDGPAALRAEAIARELGTTKGSFYWHFADLAAYKSAMLKLWQEKVASEVITEVMAAPTAWDRIDVMLHNAARAAPQEFGGPGIESAIRAWALADPHVMAALCIVDKQRVDLIAVLLSEVGENDRHLADAIYAAYIGLDDLNSKNGTDIAAGLNAILTLVKARSRT